MAVKKDAKALLAGLSKQAAPPKAKEKTPDRPVRNLQGDQAISFDSWVAASIANEVMESRKEVEAGTLYAQFLDEFAEHLYTQGFQPVNPKIQVLDGTEIDHQANFTVQARFKIGAETSAELCANLVQVLGSEGQRLFDNEIDTTPLTTLRPFNELVIGHYEGKTFVAATEAQQAVATKLLTFVQGGKAAPLTEDEKELVLIHQDQIKVKPGFFDRVKGYCKSLNELKTLFRVIVPVHFLSHAKFAVSDTPVEKHDRLVNAISEILGQVEELQEAA